MENVTDVKIVDAEKPIPVTMDAKPVSKEMEEEIRKRTEGQREINVIWEKTQRAIALFSVFAGILINALVIGTILMAARDLSVNQLAIASMCLQFINLTAGIVIGFYFSRTNHQKIGGVSENQSGR